MSAEFKPFRTYFGSITNRFCSWDGSLAIRYLEKMGKSFQRMASMCGISRLEQYGPLMGKQARSVPSAFSQPSLGEIHLEAIYRHRKVISATYLAEEIRYTWLSAGSIGLAYESWTLAL